MLKTYTFLKGGSKHFLPPANGSCGKLMPLNLFVILFTGGGVSVRGVSVQGGSLSEGVSVQEDPLYGGRAGGTHPTGMHSCYILPLDF